ncbi:protein up-regulated by thyroid hormone-putative PQQ-dependent glucose dehydrogenase [hydrothermal vent metagenome]|uniref:Protein up-regulated by thyroid hormone-putative PQQ-dependent glucose dehydrogenase n=1 Tax=hydrothermal vent metagenome TaxID=652676 RepID=A0A160VE16_9ZZZZ
MGLWAGYLWRFTFDRKNGDLWAGDEGQNSFEEVDLVVEGGNYG